MRPSHGAFKSLFIAIKYLLLQNIAIIFIWNWFYFDVEYLTLKKIQFVYRFTKEWFSLRVLWINVGSNIRVSITIDKLLSNLAWVISIHRVPYSMIVFCKTPKARVKMLFTTSPKFAHACDKVLPGCYCVVINLINILFQIYRTV